jgi:serine/threonine protein kinase
MPVHGGDYFGTIGMNASIHHTAQACHASRYQLVSLLGSGGMGEVWRAFDQQAQQFVALKRMHPALLGHPDALRRFQRECEIMERLSHPAIVGILDNQAKYGYFTMELLEGSVLSDVLAQHGRLPLQRSLRILNQVAEGPKEAHKHQLIHRDLKPSNLFLINDGGIERVKILDFGIAWIDGGTQLTRSHGSPLGTPYFVAPELLQGTTPPSPEADVYSLGVLMYKLYTGDIPLAGSRSLAHMAQILEAEGEIDPNECPPAMRSDYLRLVRGEYAVLCEQALRSEPTQRCSLLHLMARLDKIDQSYRVLKTVTKRKQKREKSTSKAKDISLQRASDSTYLRDWGISLFGICLAATIIVFGLQRFEMVAGFSLGGASERVQHFSFQQGISRWTWAVTNSTREANASTLGNSARLDSGKAANSYTELRTRSRYQPGFDKGLGLSMNLRIKRRTRSHWGFGWGSEAYVRFQIDNEHLQVTCYNRQNSIQHTRWVYGIDPTEWHRYQIIFHLDMVRFFVDGKQVAAWESERLKTTPMHLQFSTFAIENERNLLDLKNLTLNQQNLQKQFQSLSQ